MIRVKMTTPDPRIPIVRQTPGSSGIWENCQFIIDKETSECDWWVVIENLPKEETVKCPKGNTILVISETAETKKYDPKFLKQFGTIITSQRNTGHPNPIYYEQGQSWMVGHMGGRSGIDPKDFPKHFTPYDKLKAITHFEKTKTLSSIASLKADRKGQKKRREFIDALKKELGEKFDVFGAGINYIRDKWDGIAPYKYHLAIENSLVNDYWTEKLSDAFLAGAFPIYYGCPNIYSYFPKESLTVIDIEDFKGSVQKIKEIIGNNTYEKNLEKIMEARNLVLDKYNIFAVLARFCTDVPAGTPYCEITLKPEQLPFRKRVLEILRRYEWLYIVVIRAYKKYKKIGRPKTSNEKK